MNKCYFTFKCNKNCEENRKKKENEMNFEGGMKVRE